MSRSVMYFQVLERAQKEMLSYGNSGVSVMGKLSKKLIFWS